MMDTIIAVVIAALLLFIYTINGTAAKAESELDAMRVKAVEMNMAMSRYCRLVGPVVARTTFASLNDEAKYQRVAQWLSHPPASLAGSGGYVLEGYTIQFPADPNSGAVTLLDPSGNPVAY
jgi:hypothetical protein